MDPGTDYTSFLLTNLSKKLYYTANNMKMKMILLMILLIAADLSCNQDISDTLSTREAEKLKQYLSAYIQKTLQNDLFRNVNVAIQISSVDNRHCVFSKDTAKPYIPASAIKIIPSATALIKFRPDYRFQTPVLTEGTIKDRSLNGNIYLKGQGDPALTIENLKQAVQQLKKKGIAQINGDIIYDITYLDEEKNRYAPNARNLYTPACALTVNYGWLDIKIIETTPPQLKLIPQTSYAKLTYDVQLSSSFTPGRPAMTYQTYAWGDHFSIKGTISGWDRQYNYVWLGASRPALYCATLFKETCIQNNIKITGRIKQDKTPDKAAVLTTMESIELKEIVKEMNQKSNNIIAETLNKDLGARYISLPGTRQKGLSVINKFLKQEIGLPEKEFTIADASGLSHQNLFSAASFIKALNYFYKDTEIRKAFIPTLAPQGHHPHARDPVPPDDIKIYVKTGTLSVRGVNTCVGYIVLEKTKQVFSFAVLANRPAPGPMTYSGTLTNPVLKAIVNALKKYLKSE